MKALVCEKCGKTVLVDDNPWSQELRAPGMHVLIYRGKEETRQIDLCEDCVTGLLPSIAESEA